jgi:hypothetical protein
MLMSAFWGIQQWGELTKLSNQIRVHVWADKLLPVKMSFAKWTQGTLGERKDLRERWTGFWNGIHAYDP